VGELRGGEASFKALPYDIAPALSAADVVSLHYATSESPPAANATLWDKFWSLKKPLWSSEDYSTYSDADGGRCLSKLFSRNWVDANITATFAWDLFWASFDGLACSGQGMIWTAEPWTGQYAIPDTVWAAAHTTQFTSTGKKSKWYYVAKTAGGGRYLRSTADAALVVGTQTALASADGKDVTVVFETMANADSACAPGNSGWNVSAANSSAKLCLAGFASRSLVAFRTDAASGEKFVQLADVKLGADGCTQVQLRPNSLLTLSTTRGAKKGFHPGATITPLPDAGFNPVTGGSPGCLYFKAPIAAPFPFPYSTTFKPNFRDFPKYLSDIGGVFRVSKRDGYLHQQLTDVGSSGCGFLAGPTSILGSKSWRNYTVTASAQLLANSSSTAFVSVVARIGNGYLFSPAGGYALELSAGGAWRLAVGATMAGRMGFNVSTPRHNLANGSDAALSPRGNFRDLTLTLDGSIIRGSVDGKVIASVEDNTWQTGLVGVGSAFEDASFRSLAVKSDDQQQESVALPPAVNVSLCTTMCGNVSSTRAEWQVCVPGFFQFSLQASANATLPSPPLSLKRMQASGAQGSFYPLLIKGKHYQLFYRQVCASWKTGSCRGPEKDEQTSYVFWQRLSSAPLGNRSSDAPTAHRAAPVCGPVCGDVAFSRYYLHTAGRTGMQPFCQAGMLKGELKPFGVDIGPGSVPFLPFPFHLQKLLKRKPGSFGPSVSIPVQVKTGNATMVFRQGLASDGRTAIFQQLYVPPHKSDDAAAMSSARSLPLQERRWGVNIHFTTASKQSAKELRSAFTAIRQDVAWATVETTKGVYNFSVYDVLLDNLGPSVLPYLILDYGNALYDTNPSSAKPFPSVINTTVSVDGFVAYAVATMKHFVSRHALFELWNEPNGKWCCGFLDPKVYAQLALKIHAAKRIAFSSSELDAGAAMLAGPTTCGLDLKYMEAVWSVPGALAAFDAISWHPYRSGAPESVSADYGTVRTLAKQHLPAGGVVPPIVAGEWGWSTCHTPAGDPAPCVGGAIGGSTISRGQQAAFLARSFLINAMEAVPLSIYYDWKDGGHCISTNSAPSDDCYGVFENATDATDGAAHGKAKPAYHAAVAVQTLLGARQYVKRFSSATPSAGESVEDADSVDGSRCLSITAQNRNRSAAQDSAAVFSLAFAALRPVGKAPPVAPAAAGTKVEAFALWSTQDVETSTVVVAPELKNACFNRTSLFGVQGSHPYCFNSSGHMHAELLVWPDVYLLLPMKARVLKTDDSAPWLSLSGAYCKGSFRHLGCFKDKKLSTATGRDLAYNLRGCFPGDLQCLATPPNPAFCKTAPHEPACDKTTITLEKCAAKCLNWAHLGKVPFKYAAMVSMCALLVFRS